MIKKAAKLLTAFFIFYNGKNIHRWYDRLGRGLKSRYRQQKRRGNSRNR